MSADRYALDGTDRVEMQIHDDTCRAQDGAHMAVLIANPDTSGDSLTLCLPVDTTEREVVVQRLCSALMVTLDRDRPYTEYVRTDAGWHGRIRGANGEPVWTTEVLESKTNVRNAFVVLARSYPVPITDVDERTGRA